MSHLQDFLATMLAAGLSPPEAIEPGKYLRFPGVGKSGNNKAGWCLLFDDTQGGVYGCFASGLDGVWQAKRNSPFSESEQKAFRARVEKERQARQEEQMEQWEHAAKQARSLLEDAKGNPIEHPYAIIKQVNLGPHVKRGAWPQRGWDDALLFPLFGADGRVWSIQAISPKGDKDFLKGARCQGSFYPFGTIREANRVLIAEGIADAAIGHMVEGAGAIAAMGKGSLGAAAEMVRTLAPNAEICILADNDVHLDEKASGVSFAIDAAKRVGAYVAVPELDGEKADFWDLWQMRGPDAFKEAISRARWFEPPLPEHYVSAASFDRTSFSRDWIVEGFIEEGRAFEFFGKWKSGKTILVLDLCCHVSLGLNWAGRRTVPTVVLWVAGESLDDVKRRLCAWRLYHGISRPMPFYVRQLPVHLDQATSAAQLMAEVQALQQLHPGLRILVVLDTVARCLSPTANENSIESMGGFANNLLDLVVRPTGAAAINVHHSGHNDTDRSRGHSSFAAAMDGSVKVTKNGDVVEASTMLMRSGAGDDSFRFRLCVQKLPGKDNFGSPVEEPVLVFDEKTPKCAGRPKLSRRDDAALTALNRAIESKGVPPSAAIKNRFGGFSSMWGRYRKVASLTDWRAEVYPVLDTDGDKSPAAKKKAFERARKALHDHGYVEHMDDYWWPLFEDSDPDVPPSRTEGAAETAAETPGHFDQGQGAESPGQDGTERDTCPDVSLADIEGDKWDTAGQTGTDVPTNPPQPGQDGTHSYRSVPPVPLEGGENTESVSECASETDDVQRCLTEGDDDEIVEVPV